MPGHGFQNLQRYDALVLLIKDFTYLVQRKKKIFATVPAFRRLRRPNSLSHLKNDGRMQRR